MREKPVSSGPASYEDLLASEEDSDPTGLLGNPVAFGAGGDLAVVRHLTGRPRSLSWADGSELSVVLMGDGYHRLGEDFPFERIARDAGSGMLRVPRRPGELFGLARGASSLGARTRPGDPIAQVARRLSLLSPSRRTEATESKDAQPVVAVLMWLADHAGASDRRMIPASAQLLVTLGDEDLLRAWHAGMAAGLKEPGAADFLDLCRRSAKDLGMMWRNGFEPERP